MSVFRVSPKDHFTLNLMALFAVISCIAFGVTLLGFIAFHVYLVLINQTTLEYGFIQPSANPYDEGRRRNFENVFGRRPLFWFLPTDTLQVTGWDYNLGREESLPMSDRGCESDVLV